METVSKEEGMIMALERKAHELEDKIAELHADLVAFDRKEDELEAKIRELEDALQHERNINADNSMRISDLNHLLNSADRQAKADDKLIRNLRALLDEAKIVSDHWRELTFKLEDEIRGAQ